MTKAASVPKKMQPRFEAIVALADAVCERHLDREYAALARAMTAALCRKRPSPLAAGEARTWACGIVYVLGQVNFLTDKSTHPYMTTADLCAAFGVGQSTASAKARVITGALDVSPLNPAWMRADLLARHPLTWLFEVNGFIVDLRSAPRELQEAAFAEGLIPYVPASPDAWPEQPMRAAPPEQQPPGDLPLFAKAGK
jgi:hypothetical protein